MTIEEVAAAVQTQIALAAGLAGSQVIWENPNVPRPARPFISLAILEDTNEELLPEESQEDNPSPSAGQAAFLDLSTLSGGFFGAGSMVTAVDPTPTLQYQFVLDIAIDTPVLTFEVDTSNHPTALIVHCGNAAAFTGSDVIAFINGDSTASTYLTAVGAGSNPINSGRVGNIDGGYPSQDPILIQTTDRPEITVRVTAFADAPKTGAISPAFTMLKAVRRRLGTESVTEALDPLTVLDRGNVQNVTVMLETAYEGRATLDLKFGSIETESDGANTIEEVQVEVTTTDAEDDVITDDTITLPNE